MDDSDDFEIDPAIAATLGFSGFGNQGKKRKFAGNEAFVDPVSSQNQESTASSKAAAMTKSASEGNAVPLGKRREEAQLLGTAPASAAQSGRGDNPSLKELQDGVRNENGDLVIFMPNFIEDPWAELEETRKKGNDVAIKMEEPTAEHNLNP